MKPLQNKVAVVAGATRGAGRGIARALGEAGAVVYGTGRSVRGKPSPYGRPETIEETAELVSAAGGVGIAVRVDHTIEAEVRALFERVEAEQGRLDVLVNTVAGEDPLLGEGKSFWETDLSRGLEALQQAVLSHVITAKYAAPLMIRHRRGLMVEITEGDCFLGGSGNVLHDLAKSSVKQLAFRMAEELRKHRVAALAITPGFLRSESMLEHFGVTEENWREGGKKDANFLQSESPLFVGRAIAALAQDRKVLARSGDLTSSWELAREYGFTDADGGRPDGGKHFEQIIPLMPPIKEGLQRQIDWLDRIASRAKRYVGKD
ncbi:MAG: SDR family NAD(P)-dependent oxidoreductase [Gemmataceae bacterium]|nr:SDR family NAD(P)-dependent oxidoreductase [Gemmataceae bacterium]